MLLRVGGWWSSTGKRPSKAYRVSTAARYHWRETAQVKQGDPACSDGLLRRCPCSAAGSPAALQPAC